MIAEKSDLIEGNKEIERKFKVKNLPADLGSYPMKSIKQGYISIAEDGTEVRVRQKNEKYYKTIKSGVGVSRNENEKEITQEEFEKLWSETEGRMIEKNRYEITLADGNLAELDRYDGKLKGLVVVEVEFTDENKAIEFVPPEWFGEDVTNNSDYKNASLAVRGNPETIKGQQIFALEEGVEFLKKEIESRKDKQNGPLVVLIAGGSASGKTSAVAYRIQKAFEEESIILSLDDYYHDHKFMKMMVDKGINYNFDQPEAVNLDLFNTHLNLLKGGQAIDKPVYNFSTSENETTEKVEPKKIIIVEGLFALNEKILSVGDLNVFVEVDTHGRLVRRILRDIESRGENPDNILDYFAKVVEPMHQEYVESTKKSADVIILNEYNPEVEARGMKEIQLKFKGVINQEKLRKLGAERISSSIQVDTYYNPKDRDLKITGEVLRVREENGHYIVSYKGPKQSGDFRVRSKIDFEIDESTRNIFVGMYGVEILIVKKERTLYQLDGVTFGLDKVVKIENGIEKNLGEFVEIRGINSSDESKLGQVIEILGFKILDGNKMAYSEM